MSSEAILKRSNGSGSRARDEETIMPIEHPVADYASILGDDGQLIDVREPNEVAGGTLPGAVNIPLGDLPARAG
ncbi:MAG: rhodanese-like domain-containing protein, partial [Actinomycetota bacterium]